MLEDIRWGDRLAEAETKIGSPGAKQPHWRTRLARSLAHVRADVSFAFIDAFLVAMAYIAALVLRFLEDAGAVPPVWWRGFLSALPVIIAVHIIANISFGAYGHVWEFASVAEALRIVFASAVSGLALLGGVLTLRLVFDESGPLPLMVIAFGSLLTLAGMGAVRFRSRLFSFNRMSSGDRTLVVGTGRKAVELARSASALERPFHVVGFVSTGAGSGQRRLAGRAVVGELAEIPRLVDELGIQQVIVAAPRSRRLSRDLVDMCMQTTVRLRTVTDLEGGLVGTGTVRDVRDLVLTDLLPRPAVRIDLDRVAATLEGKRVLVTGAGGSIGSEIVRQVLTFEPASVVALDNDETHLHESMMRWQETGSLPATELCDVRDAGALRRAFLHHRPQVVFHAAAHKHVPILEDNPEEAIKTNVIGTANVLDLVREIGVERFVLISTDKAVDPSSVMGASKRMAEMMVQSASAKPGSCVYSSVRFGNVLGSRGSVVPTFMLQIQRGGPVTVTDPEMTRYFMTVDEAVQLVLQASALSEGGEVFVLDMGEPVKIIDLAHRLIRLSGFTPNRDIEVEIVGARPGEKRSEILSLYPLQPSSHPKVNIAQPGFPGAITLMDAVELLRSLAEAGERDAIREMLHSLARRQWDPNETVRLPAEDLAPWS